MAQRAPFRPTGRSLMALVLAAGLACAQPAVPTMAPEQITGQGFAGLQLPIDPAPGEISFAATRVWSWQDADAGGPVTRLVLDGDVIARAGGYEFRAERAVVWLQRLSGPSADAPEGVYQLYAVFDRVRTPSADAAFRIEADRLPVQGVVAPTGPISLRTDLRLDGPPTASGRRDGRAAAKLLAEAEETFRARLLELAGYAPAPSDDPEVARIDLPPGPEVVAAPEGGVQPLEPIGGRPEPTLTPEDRAEIERALTRGQPSRPSDGGPLFRPEGVFSFSVGDRIVVEAGEERNHILLSGGVAIQYQDTRTGRALELTAQRGVVFLRPGKLVDQLGSLSSADLEGIYLEGEVLASDGNYTVRGPRVYYDVRSNRAVIADAVFWTYDQRTGMPLYVRADAVRQTASRQFTAENARMANSAFFNPHFTIGVRDLTVTVNEQDMNDEARGGRAYVEAKGVTVKAGKLPIFAWPGFKGDPERVALKSITFTNSNRAGFGVRTRWNAYALLGLEEPPGLSVDALFDYYTERGPALGVAANWRTPDSFGEIDGYLVPSDEGEDVLSTGRRRDPNGDTRGMIRGRTAVDIGDGWTMYAEGGYVSDPAFVEAYDPDEAETTDEITNRIVLRRVTDQTHFQVEAKAQANDFITPQWLLQTPGYSVDKLPDARFSAIGIDLLPETAPGLFTYHGEAGYAMVRFLFSEVDAREYGFLTAAEADRAFGTLPGESLADKLRALGLDESLVGRFDTRHEISAQLNAGPIRVQPFAAVRFTHWDDSFEAFSPDENDHARWWYAGGVRVSTQIQRVNNDLDSRVFDLHRTRHIIEPSVTVWGANSTVDRTDLPIYDDAVENLLDGTMIRVGLDQTWQTMRGGPGRERSVDVLRLNTEYVWSDDDNGSKSPVGRWYSARPELANPGEFVRVSAAWQVSEAMALSGETIYDTEINQQARSSAGVLVQHSPSFSTTAEVRYLNSQDATFGFLGARYELTDKYTARVTLVWDFDEADVQTITGEVVRAFPAGALGVSLGYDNERGETNLGVLFRPYGLGGASVDGSSFASPAFGG